MQILHQTSLILLKQLFESSLSLLFGKLPQESQLPPSTHQVGEVELYQQNAFFKRISKMLLFMLVSILDPQLYYHYYYNRQNQSFLIMFIIYVNGTISKLVGDEISAHVPSLQVVPVEYLYNQLLSKFDQARQYANLNALQLKSLFESKLSEVGIAKTLQSLLIASSHLLQSIFILQQSLASWILFQQENFQILLQFRLEILKGKPSEKTAAQHFQLKYKNPGLWVVYSSQLEAEIISQQAEIASHALPVLQTHFIYSAYCVPNFDESLITFNP
ncbi:unnamed protein product [Paramecium primaurelia]|uniref:Uncharacterized protein n=1 Tax=Paramecium primaurelia TaxID=5886 RepID=A0A8S1N6K6_PARPR|nr:unnamed protein product [Paramecium primaurelia]